MRDLVAVAREDPDATAVDVRERADAVPLQFPRPAVARGSPRRRASRSSGAALRAARRGPGPRADPCDGSSSRCPRVWNSTYRPRTRSPWNVDLTSRRSDFWHLVRAGVPHGHRSRRRTRPAGSRRGRSGTRADDPRCGRRGGSASGPPGCPWARPTKRARRRAPGAGPSAATGRGAPARRNGARPAPAAGPARPGPPVPGSPRSPVSPCTPPADPAGCGCASGGSPRRNATGSRFGGSRAARRARGVAGGPGVVAESAVPDFSSAVSRVTPEHGPRRGRAWGDEFRVILGFLAARGLAGARTRVFFGVGPGRRPPHGVLGPPAAPVRERQG